jgi:hypothetical protein
MAHLTKRHCRSRSDTDWGKHYPKSLRQVEAIDHNRHGGSVNRRYLNIADGASDEATLQVGLGHGVALPQAAVWQVEAIDLDRSEPDWH